MLAEILKAAERINGIAHKTPVFTSRLLNENCGAEIFIKAENLQRAGAFKFRGAYNTISQLDDRSKDLGIITHSSGNHAQAVALSGMLLDLRTVIVMPNNAPQVKVNATRDYGAEVVFCEPTQESRISTVNELIDEYGYTLVHPYDNDQIIAGAGTAAKELSDEIADLDIIATPVGGGGLLSGSAIYCKESGVVDTVVGVEPQGADDAFRSLQSSIRVESQVPKTIADGLRTTLSERTYNYISTYVDRIALVSDAEILQAMQFVMERLKLVIEPSGAAPIAWVMNDETIQGKRIGLIISGGNLDLGPLFDHYRPLDTA